MHTSWYQGEISKLWKLLGGKVKLEPGELSRGQGCKFKIPPSLDSRPVTLDREQDE